MPPVSEKQRLAMHAAEEGRSTLGIPKSVAKEFLGEDGSEPIGHAAGIVFLAPDGDVLLLRRGGTPGTDNFVGHWGLPGGKAEEGETPELAADRETEEETGHKIGGKKKLMDRVRTPNGMVFSTFLQPTEEKFVPILDHEHTGYAWASIDMLPQPLHPSVARTLGEHIGVTEDMQPEHWDELRGNLASWAAEEDDLDEPERAEDHAMAFDRAVMAGAPLREGLAFDRAKVTVRAVDADGRMHVEVSNISKAVVNPYLGHEIPDWRLLGLRADAVYHLLRCPKELAKGAHTFNNIPLLDEHVAVTADDHRPEHVVGSTGTDADYEHPYLRNSLVLWAKKGIDAVESKRKKELSSAYRYRADMTPGEYEGKKYDGVMRDIVGNHVALVEEGRAGSDVVVGDSLNPKIKELFAMSKIKLSARASVAQGALMVFLAPKLAMDAKLDLTPGLKGLTSKNYAGKKTALQAYVEAQVDGKLAKDASIDGLKTVIDMIEEIPAAADEEVTLDPKDNKGKTATDGLDDIDDEDMAGDEDLTDEEKAAKKKEAEDKRAKDEADAAEKEKKDGKAMDAKIKLATDAAVLAERKNQQAISDAKEKVRPHVGSLSMAFDSAGAVFRHALKMLDKDVSAVKDDSALPFILEAIPLPNSGGEHRETTMAMDEASTADVHKRIPGLARIGHA